MTSASTENGCVDSVDVDKEDAGCEAQEMGV